MYDKHLTILETMQDKNIIIYNGRPIVNGIE